jgi:hypothetical protein
VLYLRKCSGLHERFRLYFLATVATPRVEFTGALVPPQGPIQLAGDAANTCTAEKGGIEGRSQPPSGGPISSIRGPLIKKACRRDIARIEKLIAARLQGSNFDG